MVDIFDPKRGDISIPGIKAPTSVGGQWTMDNMPIGQTTPAPASVTTLSASGAITASGGVAGTVATGITAGTTHTLAGATALTAAINFVATVANASDAVALPAATAAMIGQTVTVFNDGSHAAAVWPQAADAIDGGTTGAAVTLTNAKRCVYYYKAANTITSAQLGVVSA